MDHCEKCHCGVDRKLAEQRGDTCSFCGADLPIQITRTNVVRLYHGLTLHHKTNRNADLTPERWRIFGQVKTWKTRPGEFRVPIKRGLYEHSYLTDKNADEYEIPAHYKHLFNGTG
jgi:hypothetical protein